jgi:hypothetical protein
LEVNTWWKKTRDSDLWSEVIREATAHGAVVPKKTKKNLK